VAAVSLVGRVADAEKRLVFFTNAGRQVIRSRHILREAVAGRTAQALDQRWNRVNYLPRRLYSAVFAVLVEDSMATVLLLNGYPVRPATIHLKARF
jgi:hypothetical protein